MQHQACRLSQPVNSVPVICWMSKLLAFNPDCSNVNECLYQFRHTVERHEAKEESEMCLGIVHFAALSCTIMCTRTSGVGFRKILAHIMSLKKLCPCSELRGSGFPSRSYMCCLLQQHNQSVDPNLLRLAEAYRTATEKLKAGAAQANTESFEAEAGPDGDDVDDENILTQLLGDTAAGEELQLHHPFQILLAKQSCSGEQVVMDESRRSEAFPQIGIRAISPHPFALASCMGGCNYMQSADPFCSILVPI